MTDTNTTNALATAQEEFDPEMRALGMIETRGLIACIEAADAMVKAASLVPLEMRAIGGGYMTVMVRGDAHLARTPPKHRKAIAQTAGIGRPSRAHRTRAYAGE
jgi:ethanolamine utilization protein EutM